jgi:hypothetical protein
MNQRNVEELSTALNEIAEVTGIFNDWKEVETVARALTARGALMPSSLTEKQVWKLWCAPTRGAEPLYDYNRWTKMPEELERIAKGEI